MVLSYDHFNGPLGTLLLHTALGRQASKFEVIFEVKEREA